MYLNQLIILLVNYKKEDRKNLSLYLILSRHTIYDGFEIDGISLTFQSNFIKDALFFPRNFQMTY